MKGQHFEGIDKLTKMKIISQRTFLGSILRVSLQLLTFIRCKLLEKVYHLVDSWDFWVIPPLFQWKIEFQCSKTIKEFQSKDIDGISMEEFDLDNEGKNKYQETR